MDGFKSVKLIMVALPAQAFCPYIQSFVEIDPVHQRLVNKFPELRGVDRLLPGCRIDAGEFGPEDRFELLVFVKHQHLHLQPGVAPADQAGPNGNRFIVGGRPEIPYLMLGHDKGNALLHPLPQIDIIMFFQVVFPGIEEIIEILAVIQVPERVTIIEPDSIKGLRPFFHGEMIKLALQTYTVEYSPQASTVLKKIYADRRIIQTIGFQPGHDPFL